MTAKLISKILGAVFIAVGILGFIPNPIVSSTGLFVTDAAHNAVHLVTGVAFLIFASLENSKATMFLKVFGVVYLAVGVLGLVLSGGAEQFHLLGMIHMNALDNYLHLFLGAAILGLGFFTAKSANA